jgi:hypothetical protein
MAIIEHREMLEQYPNDPRGESSLVLGFVGSRPLHAVLAWATLKGEAQKMLRRAHIFHRERRIMIDDFFRVSPSANASRIMAM